MSFGPFTRSIGRDLSLAEAATSLAAQTHASSLLTPEIGFVVPSAWTNVYRMAYEKAVASLAPSRFQVMLQPSVN